jgi:GT2 family glycosyltransferase
VSYAPGPAREDLPSVTVIVPTHGRSAYLRDTLLPLVADPATTELIVVVDGHDEASASVVGQLASIDKRVFLLMPPHGGKRLALAAGLDNAHSDVVLLIDDDVVAGTGLVTGHARRHRTGEHLVVAGYMPCWTTSSNASQAFFTKEYRFYYERHCQEVEKEPSLMLRQLWGGNVSLRRSDCEAVGFTPWPYRHEDREFGLRCLRQGLCGVFDRQLYAEHRHSRDAAHFLVEARSRGAGAARLHQAFADLIGPFDPEDDLRRAGPVARWLLAHMATPERSHVVTTPLVALARGAGVLRLGRLEGWAYDLARDIEYRVGATMSAGPHLSPGASGEGIAGPSPP